MRPVLFLALLLAASLVSAEPVNVSGGVAVEGHDVVAYFLEGKPVKGVPEHSHEWNGATWRFATKENRDRFAADPRRHAPRYGGHCAYGLSRGYLVGIDPAAFTIVDGKLYLNYSVAVQADWRADMRAFIEKADANWAALLAKEAAKK